MMRAVAVVCFAVWGLWCSPLAADQEGVFDAPASDHALASLSRTIADSHDADAEVLRADFFQTKKMKNLRFPLRSSGSFIFSPAHGTCWKTIRPITNTFVITDRSFIQINHEGKREKFPKPKHPVFKQMETIFSSLFSGNVNALKSLFDVFLLEDSDQWTLGLVPIDEELKKVFESITVSGASHKVQHIVLREQIGDETSIRFQNATHAKELNEDERALFGK